MSLEEFSWLEWKEDVNRPYKTSMHLYSLWAGDRAQYSTGSRKSTEEMTKRPMGLE